MDIERADADLVRHSRRQRRVAASADKSLSSDMLLISLSVQHDSQPCLARPTRDSSTGYSHFNFGLTEGLAPSTEFETRSNRPQSTSTNGPLARLNAFWRMIPCLIWPDVTRSLHLFHTKQACRMVALIVLC